MLFWKWWHWMCKHYPVTRRMTVGKVFHLSESYFPYGKWLRKFPYLENRDWPSICLMVPLWKLNEKICVNWLGLVHNKSVLHKYNYYGEICLWANRTDPRWYQNQREVTMYINKEGVAFKSSSSAIEILRRNFTGSAHLLTARRQEKRIWAV